MARKLNIYIHGFGRDAAPRRRVRDANPEAEVEKLLGRKLEPHERIRVVQRIRSGMVNPQDIITSANLKGARDSLISGGRRPEAHNTKESPIVADMRMGAKVSDRMVVKWVIGNDETKLYNSFKEADQANKRNPGGGRTGTDKIRQVLVEE